MGNINSEQLSILERQMAESQAREKVLRDALEYILPDTPDQCRVKNNALFLADDDTALRAALAAEREKCLKACEEIHIRGFRTTAWECCDAVRALGE